jgi:alkylhydroperoxidase family enzyme
VSTVELPSLENLPASLRATFDAIARRELPPLGSGHQPAVWLAMAHHPDYLEANWQRARAVMESSELSGRERVLVGAGVAMVNRCRDGIARNVGALRQLGTAELGLTELVGVVEHTYGLARLAGALLVESDLRREIPPEAASLLGLPHGDELEAAAREVLAEVRIVECGLTGVDRVPNLWRVIASNPAYLRATWDKHKVVMAAGELSLGEKQIVALGVAMQAGSRYLVERLTRTLQRAGRSLADILEVASVVDHENCLNLVAAAMQLD